MGEQRNALEIERKYLIAMPDEQVLRAQEGCAEVKVQQVYLTEKTAGFGRRVRRWEENGEVTYRRCEKRRISAVTREEIEADITEQEFVYAKENEADPRCRAVDKTRYRIPYRGRCVEIDIFPFWHTQALAEVELESEDEPVYLPPYLTVLREVTEDARYTNRALAQSVPTEDTL